MKRITKSSFILIAAASMIAGCNGTTKEHVHSYDKNNPFWNWTQTSDGYNASLTLTCNGCDEAKEGHTVSVDATVTTSTVDSTCTSEGTVTYTAIASYDGQQFSDTKEVSIGMLEHSYSSLAVSGDYKKNYVAFEEFDASNLVVKAVCGACNAEKEVPNSEYFVIYEQFGANTLSVGDTKVVISYSGMKVDVTGLTVSPISVDKPVEDSTIYTYTGNEITYNLNNNDLYTISGNKQTNAGSYKVTVSLKDKVNYVWKDGNNEDLEFTFNIAKADNEITGLQSEYRTSCMTPPDISGVTSNAGEVTLKYYSDAECTNEVSLEGLSGGTYTVVATSGGINYKEVSKKATLVVEHIYEQEVVDDQYLKTAATEDEDGVYYKSCTCGEAGTETFVAEGTKLPTIVAPSSVDPYTVVNETAPEGYQTVTKGTKTYTDEDQGHTFLAGINISKYSEVHFAFRTANRKFCHYPSWGKDLLVDTWYVCHITEDGSGTYNVAIDALDGSVHHDYYEGVASFKDALIYCNWGGDPMEWYSTEVQGTKKSGVAPDENGVKIAESSVNPYVKVDGFAPAGYDQITKGTKTYGNDDQGKKFLADIDIHKYSSVFFAFRTANRKFCFYPTWGKDLLIDTWYICTLTANESATYDVTIDSVDGTVHHDYDQGVASFKDALTYCNYGGDNEMEWYSTEVRGIKKDGTDVVPTGVVIDNCMLSANGVATTESTEALPDGFEYVRDFAKSDLVNGQYYSAADLRNYSEVHFAFKQNGYFLFNGWSELTSTTDWMVFSLTQNDDGTWNLTITNLAGNVIHTKENMSAYRSDSPDPFTNYSLNTILCGALSGSGYISSHKDGVDLKVSATELRGTLK